MKKLIAVVMVLIGLFFMVDKAYADSPVTSTPFSKAYYNVDIVKKASGRNNITEDMADFLADENNPIDVKAAIINALSWNVNGKNNTDRYCQFIYKKSLMEIDISTLSGDQQFCIGYLLAMDDISFKTTQSMDYLRMARSNMIDSLTVAIITFLVETMNEVSYNWPDQLNQILTDTSLSKDLSEDAIKVITDYMLFGIDNPVNIPKTGSNSSVAFLYGMCAVVFLSAFINLNHNKNAFNKTYHCRKAATKLI
ncbi:MAG: cell wall-binding protein [Herbinix sp.]|nr:cell wall-binding protein [Herbinix sp.]